MQRQNPHGVAVPPAADFVGSPFTLLPRVGDKMFRPTRIDESECRQAPRQREGRRADMAGAVGVWDWG